MDNDLFLQQLRDLNLEEGRAYIQAHASELEDHAAFGVLLADEALRVLYTPLISLKLAELLIYFGEHIQHVSSHALGLKAKGDALFQIEHHQAALESLDTAGEKFLLLGDEGNWARSRISWLLSAVWLGRVEEALQEAARARSVFLQLREYYWVCVIDSNTAYVYEQIGRYQEALELYDNMLAVYPTVTGQDETFIKRSIAIAKVNKARLLTWLGKFDQAYDLQQQAQRSFDTLGEKELVILVEINLADLDFTLGYYGSALRRYYQIRDSLLQSITDDPLKSLRLAELQLSMANCLVKLNRAPEACYLSEKAIVTYRESGLSLSTANALRDHAIALVASGRLKEALTILDEAQNLYSRGGFDPLASLARLQQAELLLEMDSASTAYDLASLVKNYCDAQGMIVYSVHARLVMAGALIQNAKHAALYQEKEQSNGLLNEAISLCKQGTLQTHQHNLQEEIYKSHYLLGQIYILQGNLANAARHYSAAIAQIEHILNNLTHDLSPSFLRSTWTIYEEMIALCLKEAQAEQAFRYLERVRSLTLRQHLNKSKTSLSDERMQEETVSMAVLRTQFELKDWQGRHRYYSVLLADIDSSVSPTLNVEIIQTELKRCEAKLSELFERQHLQQLDILTEIQQPRSRKRKKNAKEAVFKAHVDIEQIRQYLLPEQLLLTYYLYKGRLVIFALTKEHLITHENPDGASQLERLLPLLHAHLQPGGWPDPLQPPQQVIRRLLNKLYDLLIAPIVSLLPSPSGHLTIVPYGPLHKLPFHALYDGSRFLIEDFQVSYLPASSLLTHLGSSRSEQTGGSPDMEVSFKQPLVFGYSEKGHLERVQDEATTIAAMLDGRCYLEREATIVRLIEEAPNCPIIHLATHGQSRLDAPNFSYVRLADGQLNAIDAFGLNLKGCELVTLSGCETGLALSGGGDEQLGLGRAFLASGASSLVMSLWSVEDNATSEFMQRFYLNLLRGESKVQALRAAQCSLLHHTGTVYAHPYFWAPFRLVGDVGSLKYARAKARSFALAIETLKK